MRQLFYLQLQVKQSCGLTLSRPLFWQLPLPHVYAVPPLFSASLVLLPPPAASSRLPTIDRHNCVTGRWMSHLGDGLSRWSACTQYQNIIVTPKAWCHQTKQHNMCEQHTELVTPMSLGIFTRWVCRIPFGLAKVNMSLTLTQLLLSPDKLFINCV